MVKLARWRLEIAGARHDLGKVLDEMTKQGAIRPKDPAKLPQQVSPDFYAVDLDRLRSIDLPQRPRLQMFLRNGKPGVVEHTIFLLHALHADLGFMPRYSEPLSGEHAKTAAEIAGRLERYFGYNSKSPIMLHKELGLDTLHNALLKIAAHKP